MRRRRQQAPRLPPGRAPVTAQAFPQPSRRRGIELPGEVDQPAGDFAASAGSHRVHGHRAVDEHGVRVRCVLDVVAATSPIRLTLRLESE